MNDQALFEDSFFSYKHQGEGKWNLKASFEDSLEGGQRSQIRSSRIRCSRIRSYRLSRRHHILFNGRLDENGYEKV